MKHKEFSLQKYSVMAGVFIIMQNNSIAEVIYTDIEPDIILDEGGEAAELDMNDDGISDFFFHNNSFQYYDTSWLSIRTMNNILAGPDEVGNALAGISNYFNTGYNGFTWYYPFALEQNIAINEELTWQETETQIMALRVFSEDGAVVGHGGYCYWSETKTINKCLGVKFKDLDNQLHYGWIRCDVKDEGRTLIINLNELISGIEIHVYDITGKKVYSDGITNLLTQIELTETKGTYIVTLISPEGAFTKKIFIN